MLAVLGGDINPSSTFSAESFEGHVCCVCSSARTKAICLYHLNVSCTTGLVQSVIHAVMCKIQWPDYQSLQDDVPDGGCLPFLVGTSILLVPSQLSHLRLERVISAACAALPGPLCNTWARYPDDLFGAQSSSIVSIWWPCNCMNFDDRTALA